MAVCEGKWVVEGKERKEQDESCKGEYMPPPNSNAMGCGEYANTMSTQRREEIERLTFYGRGGQEVMRLYKEENAISATSRVC